MSPKEVSTLYRSLIFSILAMFFLAACASTPGKEPPGVTATFAPAAQPSISVPSVQPTIQTGWLSQLETIEPQNWKRLQILKTFPAEMPMKLSAVTVAPDGKTVVMGSSTGAQLFFFDIESGKLSRTMPITGVQNADSPFNTIEYLADGTIIANSDGPYEIYHIDHTGNVLATWDSINFAVSADQQTMAMDADGGTSLLKIANNIPIASLKNTNGMGYSFSPDNSKIAMDVVTVDYANVDIWDIKNQTILETLHNMYDVSYSPNGKFLAALDSVNNSLDILSPDGAVQITTILDAHSEYLISPDGALIAYQTANGSSVAKDTTSWESSETTLRGRLDCFSSDGRILITRTDDGGILIWGVLKVQG